MRQRKSTAFLKHEKLLLRIRTLLRGAVAVTAFFLVASLADVLFEFGRFTAFFLIIAASAAAVLLYIRSEKALERNAMAVLSVFYKNSDRWLPYSPAVLVNIARNEYSGSLNTGEQMSLMKNLNGLWSLGAGRVIAAHLRLKDLYLLILLVFFTVPAVTGGYSVFYFAASDRLLPESAYRLSPEEGRFFRGNQVKIMFQVEDNRYKAGGIQIRDENGRFVTVTADAEENGRLEFAIESLMQKTRFRAFAYKGWRQVYTPVRTLGLVQPGYFQQIKFRIQPPAYTRVKQYTSTDNLMKVYYGSVITAEITTENTAELYRAGTEKLEEVSPGEFTDRFVYRSRNPLEVRYRLTDTVQNSRHESMSPVYEFWPAEDRPPSVSIPGAQSQYNFPEAGILALNVHAVDDFGFREVVVAALNEGRVKAVQKLQSSAAEHRKTENGATALSWQIEFDLSAADSDSLTLIAAVRDNSLIPGRIPWHSRPRPGQVGISEGIQIQTARNEAERDELQTERREQLVSELAALKVQYENSESELQNLLKRGAAGEVIDDELNEWKTKRENIRKELARLQRRVTSPESNASEEEKFHGRHFKENVSDPLNEEISAKEKELRNLLKNFPQNHLEVKQRIEAMSRKDYLENLENSIKHLKSRLDAEKLRKLQKKIDNMTAEINRAAADALEADGKQKENIEKKLSELGKQFRQVSEEAEQLQNRMKNDLSAPSENQWRQALQRASENNRRGDTPGLQKNLSEMSRQTMAWSEKVQKVRQQQTSEKLEKAMRAFRQAAFRVNEVSRVWEERSEVITAKMTDKTIRTLGDDLGALRDSYRVVLNDLMRKAGSTGMLDPSLAAELQSSLNFFSEVQSNLENRMAMSLKANGQRLNYKLNRASMRLLREMGNMRMQIAAMQQSALQQRMQQAGESQKEMAEQMQKMNEKRGSSLSESEQQYLKELSERQRRLEKSLREATEGKQWESTAEKKKADELASQLYENSKELARVKKRSQLKELKEKTEKLSQKFLESIRTRQKRNELSEKRQAEKPAFYEINDEPEEMPVIEKRDISEDIYMKDLKGPELEFYRRYLQQLETQ